MSMTAGGFGGVVNGGFGVRPADLRVGVRTIGAKRLARAQVTRAPFRP